MILHGLATRGGDPGLYVVEKVLTPEGTSRIQDTVDGPWCIAWLGRKARELFSEILGIRQG